ncbi:MAG: MATE family efflux transporter [Saccharofermentanales bacterium]
MLKTLFGKQDMTIGTPWKKILYFSVPLLIGNIAQQMYNTVDSIVVGQYVGDNALKAIGSSAPVLHLLIIFFTMIGTGSSIMVSQYYGARDRINLSKSINTALAWTAIISTALLILGLFITEPLLKLTRTPDTYIGWSKDYLTIYFWGVHGLAFYNILAGILRGLGDSISSLVFVLIATMLNIVLDLYFVRELGLGVAGVAIATVISQYVSAILTLLRLRRYQDFDFSFQTAKPDWKTSRDLFRLGIPSGIMQSMFAVSMLFVQSLTNQINIADISTMVIRVDGFAMLPNFTFGIAMATFTGQNVGAGKMHRLKQGVKQGLAVALVTTITLTGLLIVFGKNIMRLFTKTEANVELAYSMMLVLTVGYIAFAITQVLSGVMRGAGDTLTPMWVTIFNNIVFRIPMAYLIAHLTKSAEWPHGRPISTFGSLVLTWFMGTILIAIFFKRGRWKDKALVKTSPVTDEDMSFRTDEF